MPVNTYYFDGSDAAATDPNSVWTDDSNAFDYDLTPGTYAYTTSFGSVSSNFLKAEGTNSPTLGNTITQVRVRVYTGDTDTAPGWSSYATLTAPAAGWDWSTVAALETKIYMDVPISNEVTYAYVYTNGLGESLGNCSRTLSSTPSAVKVYKVEIEVTSYDFNYYYFNASDSGPTDTGGAWADDSNAFNGDTSTFSYPTIAGTPTTNLLTGDGTNAPTTGDTISLVKARGYIRYENENSTQAQIWVQRGGESLGSVVPNYGTYGWTSYTTLSTPSGGWTWSKVNDLELEYWSYGIDEGLNYVRWYKIEVLVQSDPVAVGVQSLTFSVQDQMIVTNVNDWPYEEGFNSLIDGEIVGQDNWFGSTGVATVGTYVPDEGTKCVRITKTGPTTYSVATPPCQTNPESGIFYVSMKYAAESPTNEFYFQFVSNTGNIGVVSLASGGDVRLYKGMDWDVIGSWTYDTWHRIGLRYDFGGGRIQANVDNGTWSNHTIMGNTDNTGIKINFCEYEDSVYGYFDTISSQYNPTFATYYFDATDSGPTDNEGVWTNDGNAFDGETANEATSLTGDSVTEPVTNLLIGGGTNAPSSNSDEITQVKTRIYGDTSSDGSPAWGDYVILNEPSGGWTWQKINDLSVKLWGDREMTGVDWRTRANVYSSTTLLNSDGTISQKNGSGNHFSIYKAEISVSSYGTGNDTTATPSILSETLVWPAPTISFGEAGGVTASAGLQSCTFTIQSSTISVVANLTTSASLQTTTFTVQTATASGVTNITANAGIQSAIFSLSAPTESGDSSFVHSIQYATFTTQSVTVYLTSNIIALTGIESATFASQSVSVLAKINVEVPVSVQTATYTTQEISMRLGAIYTLETTALSTFTVQSPSVLLGLSLVATLQEAAFLVVIPTIIGNYGVSVDANVQSCTFTSQAVTISAGVGIVATANIQSGTFTIESSTPFGILNIEVSTSVQTATWLLVSCFVATDAILDSSLIAGTFIVEEPTITAGGNITVEATLQECVFTVQIPTVSTFGGTVVQVAMQSTTFSIETITIIAERINGYNSFKADLMNGNIDLNTDSFKCMLVDATYVFDEDAHDRADDITGEITGSGYSAGGETITGLIVAEDDANNQGTWSINNVQWSIGTFTAYGAVIYKDTGDPSTSPLVVYIDFGRAIAPVSQSFTIQWSAEGLLNVRDY